MSGLNVLVVGAGMYVCGKNTDGLGTVFPSLVEAWKKGFIEKVYIAATSEESVAQLKNKIEKTKKVMGAIPPVEMAPLKGSNSDAYLELASHISGPKAAIVCTPNDSHFKVTKDLFGRDFPCLVVKPLTPTVSEAKELIKIQKEKKLYGAVEFHKRFDRSNLKVKQAIHSGQIGDPLYWLVEYSQRKVIPEEVFKSWAADSNIFEYLAVHYVDIINFCTGAVAKRLFVSQQNCYLDKKGIKTPDAIQAMIEWEMPSGHTFNSVFLTNWIDSNSSTAMSDQKLKVIGTFGRIEADQKNRGLELVSEENLEHINPDFCQFYDNGDGTKRIEGYGVESVVTFISDVLNLNDGKISLETLEKERPTFSSTLESIVVVEAINKALAADGQWFSIDR